MNEEFGFVKKNILFALLRGFAGAGICFAVKSLTSFILFASAAGQTGLFTNTDVPNYIIYIITFASSFLLYGSVIGCLCKYNAQDFDKYLLLEEREMSLFGKIKYYLKNGLFYLEFSAFAALISFSALLGGCPEIFGMFHTGEGVSPFSAGILPALIMPAIIFPIYLFKKCDMLPYFEKLIKLKEEEKVQGRVQPILRILLICLLYPLVSPLLPLIPMVAVTLLSISITLATAITFGGFLGVFVGGGSIFYLLRLAVRAVKRKRLVRIIEDTATRADCRAADFENVYLSLISRKRQMRFNVYRGKAVYNVLLISAISKRFPICFTSDRSGYHDHIVGMKHAHFTIMHHYFGYEPKGDGIQILIIHPEPKSVFIIEGDEMTRLYNAGRLYDFTAYDKEAFLGALRRGILGKYDGQKSDERNK